MQAHPGETTGAGRNLAQLAKRELLRFLVLFLYLWAMFLLFELHQFVVLSSHQIPYESWGLGLVNALVLAKVMLVAEEVRFRSPLRAYPLIVSILARSLAFALLFIVVDIAEKLLLGVFHGKTVSESIPQYGGGGLLARLIVGIIIAVSLIPYFAFQAIDRMLGQGRLGELLLRKPTSPDSA